MIEDQEPGTGRTQLRSWKPWYLG